MLVNKVSFAVSFAYFLISIVIIMLLITVYVKSKESSKFKYFAEIYDGFKSSHLSKFYHIIFLLRRLLITAIVILMRDTKIYTKLGIYLCLQIISFLYIAVMRPSESVQQNMIDFWNDLIYVIGVLLVTYIQNPVNRKQWDIWLIYLLIANWVIVFIINFMFFLVNWVKACKSKKISAKSISVPKMMIKTRKIKPTSTHILSSRSIGQVASFETSRDLSKLLLDIFKMTN